MAIQLAALEEVGERDLLDARGPPIGEELFAADSFQQRGRHDQPAEPEGGGERLARRAGALAVIRTVLRARTLAAGSAPPTASQPQRAVTPSRPDGGVLSATDARQW